VSVSDPAAHLREELRALERAYTIGHHGLGVAGRRAGLVDACLVELFERAGSPAGVAILATLILFFRRDRVAGLLLLPYLAWTLFATLLTQTFGQLNQ